MKTNNTKKGIPGKIFSLFLAALMVMYLFPVASFAAEAEKNQIVESGSVRYYGSNGEEVTANPALGTNSVVNISKTIAKMTDKDGNPIENEFEITLEAKTIYDIQNVDIQPDIATVLVIDTSGSMADPSSANSKTTRIDAAKKAAKDFLDSYVNGANGAKRYVSMVTFATSAATSKFNNSLWIDVSVPANMELVKKAIDKLEANGGTFLQGGLMLARNLYGTSIAPKLDDGKLIENRFVVLLTDGNPTYRNNTIGTGYSNSNNKSTSSIDCVKESNYGSENTTSVPSSRAPAATVAGQIRSGSEGNYYNAKMYTVAFGTSSTSYKINTSSSTKMVATDWMKDHIAYNSSYGYSSSDAGSLNMNFQNIAASIARWAQAWTISDPMANVSFTSAITDGEADYITMDAGVLNIDLKKMNPTANDGKVYTYTYTYSVRLENTVEGFKAESPYETNGTTTLTYVMQDTNGFLSEPMEAEFTIPEVKGYEGTLSFQKVAAHNQKGLPGAAFTLTMNNNSMFSMKAISGEDGSVTFTNIPSGHSYTLTETNAPYEYTADSKTYTVNVSFGEVAILDNGTAITNLKVENKLNATVDISVNKVWNTTIAPPDSVTVELLQNGCLIGQSAVLNGENGWQYTFTGLEKYNAENGEQHVYNVIETYVGSDAISNTQYISTVVGAEYSFTVINTIAKPIVKPEEKPEQEPEATPTSISEEPEATPTSVVEEPVVEEPVVEEPVVEEPVVEEPVVEEPVVEEPVVEEPVVEEPVVEEPVVEEPVVEEPVVEEPVVEEPVVEEPVVEEPVVEEPVVEEPVVEEPVVEEPVVEEPVVEEPVVEEPVVEEPVVEEPVVEEPVVEEPVVEEPVVEEPVVEEPVIEEPVVEEPVVEEPVIEEPVAEPTSIMAQEETPEDFELMDIVLDEVPLAEFTFEETPEWIEIISDEVPLAEFMFEDAQDTESPEWVEIIPDEVPLAESPFEALPKTGDNNAFYLWAVGLAISLAFMAFSAIRFFLTGKKTAK